MIADLDASLQAFLQGEAVAGSELAGATITFTAPDHDWQATANGLILNVYLMQIAENRELRSNERRLRPRLDGTTTLEQFPARVECFYLLSAWNWEQAVVGVAPAADPEQKEHRLLSQALAILLRHGTFPAKYLVPGLASQALDLPVISAQPADTPGATPDFWSGFGTYLRPSITCKITLSLDLQRDVTGPMVSTASITAGPAAPPDRIDGSTADQWYMIGGTVRSTAPPKDPIAGTWIYVQETGQLFVTDADGRFLIDRLAGGNYTFTARAVGYQDGGGVVPVPGAAGSYDISLTPI
jgi:hypothetical protein